MSGYHKPSTKDWQIFFERLFLWSAGVTFSLSVVFFIAYNWNILGKFFKFALVEVILISGVVLSLYFFDKKVLFLSMLTTSTIIVGTLMALFGQVYQTGADNWELFFYWALMILPWVVVSNFVGLWILWVLLISLSMLLYDGGGAYQIFFRHLNLWEIFIFNFGFLLFWELKKIKLQKNFLLTNLLHNFSSITITILVVLSISSEKDVFTTPIWILWLITIYYLYRKREINISALSSMSVSILIVIATFFLAKITRHGETIILGLTFITVIVGGGLSLWLKSIYEEVKNER